MHPIRSLRLMYVIPTVRCIHSYLQYGGIVCLYFDSDSLLQPPLWPKQSNRALLCCVFRAYSLHATGIGASVHIGRTQKIGLCAAEVQALSVNNGDSFEIVRLRFLGGGGRRAVGCIVCNSLLRFLSLRVSGKSWPYLVIWSPKSFLLQNYCATDKRIWHP